MEKELDIEIYRSERDSYHCVVHRGNDSFTDTVNGWVSNDTTGLTPSSHASVSGCISSALRLIDGHISPASASSSSEALEGVSKSRRQGLVPYFLAKLENCKSLWVNRRGKRKVIHTFDIEVVCVELGGVHLMVTSPDGSRRRTVEVLFTDINDNAPELVIDNAVNIFLAKTDWGHTPEPVESDSSSSEALRGEGSSSEEVKPQRRRGL